MSGGSGGSASATARLGLTVKGDLLTFNTAEARLAVSATNGQVLTTNSAVADGIEWATPTDVQPPTTTKGDLSGFSTSQARIPVSATNGQVLTTDSTEALGLKWAAAAAGDPNYKYLQTIALSSPNHVLELTTGLENYDNVWIEYYLELGVAFEPQFNVYQVGGALAGALGTAISVNGASMGFTASASTVPINAGNTTSNTSIGNIVINNGNGSSRTDPPAIRYGGAFGQGQMMLAGTSNSPAAYSTWSMKLSDAVQIIGIQFRNSATVTNTFATDSYANIYVGRDIS